MRLIESRWFRSLVGSSPMDAFGLVARTSGLPADIADRATELFSSAKRIDIHPLGASGQRGWIMIIDQKFSLWFFRQGNTLVYDGFEFGDYSTGERLAGLIS